LRILHTRNEVRATVGGLPGTQRFQHPGRLHEMPSDRPRHAALTCTPQTWLLRIELAPHGDRSRLRVTRPP
jgi:hypothetical protein